MKSFPSAQVTFPKCEMPHLNDVKAFLNVRKVWSLDTSLAHDSGLDRISLFHFNSAFSAQFK